MCVETRTETKIMDTNHLTQDQIERFALPATTPDAERTRANAHIQSCAQCQTAFAQALRPFTFPFLAEREAPEECLENEIMVRYVQRVTDAVEREIVEMHLETCVACRAEMEQLAAFYKAIENEDAEPAREPDAKPGRFAAFQARLSALREAPRLKTSFAMGGMLLAGAAAMLLVLWPRSAHIQQDAARQRLQAQAELRQAQTERQTTLQLLASAKTEKNNNPTQRFSTPADAPIQELEPLRSHSATMSGGSEKDAVLLLSPQATKVGSLRPLLEWKLQRPLPKATKVELTLVDAQTQESHVLTLGIETPKERALPIYSPDATAPHEMAIQVPDALLKPATKYRWSVAVKDASGTTIGGSSPNEETLFLTPSASELEQLGQVYTHMGILDAAEQALSATPRSATARQTLEKVRKARAELTR